ncbi:MAG: hypothetical protein ACRD6W_03960 [Nitrososphaerales archaeon]
MLAAAAALFVTAFASINLLTQVGPVSLVDRALAAAGTAPVLHVELERNLANQLIVSLHTGTVSPVSVTIQSWYDTRTGTLRLSAREGTVPIVLPANPRASAQVAAHLAALDPATEALLRDYRDAIRTATIASTSALELHRGLLKGTLTLSRHGKPVAWRSAAQAVTWHVITLDSEMTLPHLASTSPKPAHTLQTKTAALRANSTLRFRGTPGQISRFTQVLRIHGHIKRLTAIEITYGRVTECVGNIPEPTCGFSLSGLTAASTITPPPGMASLYSPENTIGPKAWICQFQDDGLFISIAGQRSQVLSLAKLTTARDTNTFKHLLRNPTPGTNRNS